MTPTRPMHHYLLILMVEGDAVEEGDLVLSAPTCAKVLQQQQQESWDQQASAPGLQQQEALEAGLLADPGKHRTWRLPGCFMC